MKVNEGLRSINFQTLMSLINAKWASVALKTFAVNLDELEDWVDANCASKVRFHGALFVFENEQEAMLFALRWS